MPLPALAIPALAGTFKMAAMWGGGRSFLARAFSPAATGLRAAMAPNQTAAEHPSEQPPAQETHGPAGDGMTP